MSEWIDVNDRLPEDFVDILAYVESEQTHGYNQGDMYFSIDAIILWNDTNERSFRGDRFKMGKVLYWMPLPQAPNIEAPKQ